LSTLDGLICQVLAELSILPHGTITAYNPTGGHSDVPMGCPPGERWPPYDRWLAEYKRAGDDERRLTVVLTGIRAELKEWRPPPREPVKGETQAELNARIVKDGEGWEVEKVAAALKVTPKMVRKARRDVGVDPEWGKRRTRADIVIVPERRAEIERLRLPPNNLTLRQISGKLGIPLTTIHRDLAA